MTESLFYTALFAVGVLSGGTAAVIGFGIGSLLTPLLLTRFDPHLAVSLVVLPHLVATAARYVQHRRAVDRTVLIRFGVPSAIGGLLGAVLQNTLRSPALILVLAMLLVMTGAANLTRGFGGWQPGPRAATILGGLSGLFGGLVGNQGGLRAAGLTAFALAPRPYLATSTAVALVIDAARTPVYLARAGTGLLAFAVPIVIATAGCLLGTIWGERVFLRLGPERYRSVVGWAVIVLGVWLIVMVAR